ncbi:MAG TPA: BamA/TamA family outer membrane protein, partial [Gemmatimonadaceae bacterium]
AHLHLINGTIKVDSRNDSRNPWSGWFATADYEHGQGDVTSYAPRSLPIGLTSPAKIEYSRVFADIRRYNRVSPGAQLNLRLVTGGWVNGDPLPLQRRFSVDGAGSLPGYDFHSPTVLRELTCTTGNYVPGIPGQCDRMALGQIEYRGDLHFNLFTDWDDDHYMRSRSSGVWVFFADAGRGWLVGAPGDSLSYSRNKLPPLSTFKTDLGLGLDFSVVGVYVAKAMNAPTNEPVNLFLRIRHRF